MLDDEFGEDFTEVFGSSDSLDVAGFGDFTHTETQVDAIERHAGDDVSSGHMPLHAFGNSDPERLNHILDAIDNSAVADPPLVPVPMDMITQLYHQF